MAFLGGVDPTCARRGTRARGPLSFGSDGRARAADDAAPRAEEERGQSVVELALILPVLLFILLGIADFARIYTTQLSIESAAREAADFGALYPWSWDPTDPPNNKASTVQEMKNRACTAARNLPDYIGSDTDADGVDDECTNPSFGYVIDTPPGVDEADCHTVPRSDEPCKVTVTLGYVFDLIIPVNIAFGDGTLGLPSTLSFERTSTFAISDFDIDQPTP
jgi:hypothetical protein